MKATYIDYKETNSFSSAVIRYLEHDPQLESFISHFPTIDGFRKLIDEKNVLSDRQILATVLKEQYSRLSTADALDAKVSRNIELLREENTFTITTGHQLNIFTGPLYFIFKIVTAIKLAARLKAQFPEKNFVPVYWMASEDHDFAEINHTRIAGKKIEWEEQTAGATGRMSTRGMQKALSEYKAILGVGDHAKELADLMDAAYRSHPRLADATRSLVNSLFQEYGLVIIDADHPELKRQFSAYVEEDILHQCSYKNIEASIRKLTEAGIQSQVNPREINFFYLKDQIRERLVFENNRYYVLNTDLSFSTEELKDEISIFPERFSPNVVMRPLYQEVILPNLAYVGGGAELVYWLELKENFDHYHVDFPLLILRNSALIATEDLSGRLSRLALTYSDLFDGSEQLKKKWVLAHSTRELHVADEWEEIEKTFARIKSKAGGIDPTLQPSTDAIQSRLKKAILNLEKKFLRAEKRNYATSLTQIDTLKQRYWPNGSLQERSENFGLIYAKYNRHFIQCLLDTFEPLEFKFTILELADKN